MKAILTVHNIASELVTSFWTPTKFTGRVNGKNTAPVGRTGSASSQTAGVPFAVTTYAVDSYFNYVNNITKAQIGLTSDDPNTPNQGTWPMTFERARQQHLLKRSDCEKREAAAELAVGFAQVAFDILFAAEVGMVVVHVESALRRFDFDRLGWKIQG